MAAPRAALSAYLARFVAWSALVGLLHFIFFPSYAALLLLLGGHSLELMTGNAIALSAAPGEGIVGNHGFLLSAAAMAQPFHYPHNLYSISLNFMFAPALVMTTLSAGRQAVLRALGAMLIMLLLHAYHLVTIALYFPLTQAPIPNPVIAADFPRWLAAFVQWNYRFTDKMGYTLFPFVAWFVVCFPAVVELFSRWGRPVAGGAEERT